MNRRLCNLFAICIVVAFLLSFSACSNSNLQDNNDEKIPPAIEGPSEELPGDLDDNCHSINRNLLINGNFVINQRGKASYTGAAVYTVDRWRIGSGPDITVIPQEGGGVKIENDNETYRFLGQLIELCEITEGTTLTMSAKIDGELYSVTGEVPAEVPDTLANVYYFQNDYMRFGYCGSKDSWYAELIIPANTDITVDYVKLEEGGVSTAPYGMTDSYAVELLKCQRYFRVYTEVTPVVEVRYDPNRNADESYLVVSVFLENEMRVRPELDSFNQVTWFQVEGTFYSFNSTYMQIIGVEKNRFQLLVFTGKIFEGYNRVTGNMGTVYITLDAEI